LEKWNISKTIGINSSSIIRFILALIDDDYVEIINEFDAQSIVLIISSYGYESIDAYDGPTIISIDARNARNAAIIRHANGRNAIAKYGYEPVIYALNAVNDVTWYAKLAIKLKHGPESTTWQPANAISTSIIKPKYDDGWWKHGNVGRDAYEPNDAAVAIIINDSIIALEVTITNYIIIGHD